MLNYAIYGIMSMETNRAVFWIGSSLKDLKSFPELAQRVVGFALWRAQEGKRHPSAKSLKAFGGANVVEIVENYDGEACRVVYTIQFREAVYVLHAFQKKSKRGRATPKRELEVVVSRIKAAEEHYAQRQR